MSSKQQRQQMIVKIIASHNVSSQPELQKLLARNQVDATQATISRDLEELGAVKVRVAGGEPKYAIPEFEPQRVAPSDQLRRVVGEWVAEVTHSGNLVVVRTPPGCAHVRRSIAVACPRSSAPWPVTTPSSVSRPSISAVRTWRPSCAIWPD